jgi:hypothetical protein
MGSGQAILTIKMSMKDRQEKGQRLQKDTANKIVELVPDLTPEDVQSCPPYKHGADIILSDKAKKKLKIKIECKNYGRWKNVYTQLEYGTKHDGDYEPVLIIADEGGKTKEGEARKPLAIMDRDYYFELIATKERLKSWIKKQMKINHS